MSAIKFILSGRGSLPPQYQVNFYQITEQPMSLDQARDMPTYMLESLQDRVKEVAFGHMKVDQCFSIKTINPEIQRELLIFCKRVQQISTWGGITLLISNVAGWFFLSIQKLPLPAKKWMIVGSLVSGLLLYRCYGSLKFARFKESDIQSKTLVEEADDFAEKRKEQYPQDYLSIKPYNRLVHSTEILCFFRREFSYFLNSSEHSETDEAMYVAKFLEIGRRLLREEFIHPRMPEREKFLHICQKFKQFESYVQKESAQYGELLKFKRSYQEILGIGEYPFNIPTKMGFFGPEPRFDSLNLTAYQNLAFTALIEMLPNFEGVRTARCLARKFDSVFYPIVKEFIKALFENKPIPMYFGVDISRNYYWFEAPKIPQWDKKIPEGFHEYAKTLEPSLGNVDEYKVFIDLIATPVPRK